MKFGQLNLGPTDEVMIALRNLLLILAEDGESALLVLGLEIGQKESELDDLLVSFVHEELEDGMIRKE